MAWSRATKYQVAKLVHNDVPVSHPLVLRKLPKGLNLVTIIKNRSVNSDDSICRGNSLVPRPGNEAMELKVCD